MDLVPKIGTVWYSVHCSKKGSYYRDRVPIGTFFTFWVPIFFRSLFSVCCYIHANNVNSVCKHTAIRKLVLLTINMSVMSKFMHNYCRYWFCVSLLVNSNLFSCLCVKFHEQWVQVPILVAEGPYFIKSWVPIRSLYLSLQVPINFWNSATPIKKFFLMASLKRKGLCMK